MFLSFGKAARTGLKSQTINEQKKRKRSYFLKKTMENWKGEKNIKKAKPRGSNRVSSTMWHVKNIRDSVRPLIKFFFLRVQIR